MVNKIYIVRPMFLPNSAVNNRMMGHLRAFSEAGVEVEAAFISPNANCDKISEEIPGVKFHYCWDKSNVRNRYVRVLLSYWWIWRYVKSLPKGSVVLLLGSGGYMGMFLRRKDLNVYYEITEHPSLALNKRQLKAYVKKCEKLKHIFVISRPLRQFFLDRGFPKERVTIVNVTVDPKRFDGVEKQTSQERYIAYCGTVTNNKDGVDDLIKAFAITHQSHPDVKLYIIGAIPDKDDKVGNMMLIKNLGVETAVVLTGVVSAREMPQLLKNAAVLALDRPDSVQAQNGFPTKLGEYLLTGNPVVVTKVGDIPYFLKDGVNALLCEDRKEIEFSKKLTWALDNEERARIIGGAGKEVALKYFDCIIEGNKIISEISKVKV